MFLRKKYALSFAGIMLIALELQAQPVVKLVQTEKPVHIGKKALFFEDPTSGMSIDHILSPLVQEQFEPYHQDIPNFKGTASAYWLKFQIEKIEKGDYYLEVGTSFMDSISLYELDKSGHVHAVRHSGDDFPFDHREIKVSNYHFQIDPADGAATYYLRVKSNQPLFFPLRVGSIKAFMEFSHKLDFIQGIYFGFMLLIFLYNLFLYLSIREKIYLLYIGYVASITCFMAAIFGYFFEYLWPQSPWINQQVVITSGLTMIAATVFTRNFLDTKNTSRWLHGITHVFLVAGILVVVLIPLNFKIQGLVLAQVALLLMSIYYLFLGIYYFSKGYTPAKFYLTAWGCLVIGIFFGMLESLDVIPVMKYLNAMQIGSALEVMFLSFALGDRINTYKRQREDALSLALKTAQENQCLMEEQNEQLEKRIDERTEMISRQNNELLQLNEEKNTLISVVAHDLRMPLNHIKGFLNLFKMENPELAQQNSEYIDAMTDASNRMSEMISRVLDINAIESKKINLKMEVANIHEILEYVEKNTQMLASKKRIDISSHYTSEKLFARVDRNYLIQVLENLVSNAIKFSPKGTTVYLSLEKIGKVLEISVRDEGPGISESDQKRLFFQFQKLSAKPTGGEVSTGLGLSIVKKYVEAMEGSIRCESKLGEGTQFVVTFEALDEPKEVLSE